MSDEDDAKRLRWERATAWPGIGASVLFLIAYSWNILDETKSATTTVILVVVLVAVWAFFVLDFVTRLVLARHKSDFVRHNLVDLLSVFVPMARPFRLLTGLRHLPGLQGNSGSHLRRRVIIIAASFIIMFIYVISLAEFQVERYAHGSNIRSFGDSVWWACVTMATVGYGDYYPVTVPGRVLAVVLMVGGVAIVGTASATIVNYLNERTRALRHDREEQEQRLLDHPALDHPADERGDGG
ncbi:potassium channel family protein [Leifsonia sp. fls2-241-R2A-40a]|uniref:potassium channel family protein n=1 Tax=Leifsonia sp. fls2-241-R2A-40a TaxID=3040290 RepID=UPI00254BD0CC|nr:potassium channel family protein [Leifsonia sp. fls2-241-R2A-40a]